MAAIKWLHDVCTKQWLCFLVPVLPTSEVIFLGFPNFVQGVVVKSVNVLCKDIIVYVLCK